ncbi:MAG: hypothetical protein JRF62_07895, partial [Deltaproteobacteria bacterium]|nr:hypothetical protein [Deltaproteobacteria bacterium]MBW2640961.1 hypothetical protein [Deltaproteobacteria bacterium]
MCENHFNKSVMLPMILPAVFLLSLSSIAFEVLLTRVFSISQWNHLSFMVISIALFGFAAAGTFLNIIDTYKKDWEQRLSASGPVKIFILLYTVTAIGSFIVLNRIPLDYFRLPLEPAQIFYLLTAYLVLALPFFFAGLVISLAYAFIPEKTGFVYFASMAGSACGAILPVPFLPLLGEGRFIILAALIPLIIIPFERTPAKKIHTTTKTISRGKPFALRASALLIVLIAGLIVSMGDGIGIKVTPSPYKDLSRVLKFPDTRIFETVTGLRGRFDSVQSPYIRFAPGLSLKFKGTLPEQQAIYKDGDTPFFIYKPHLQKDECFSKFTLPYAGYMLVPKPEHILLIHDGGGSAIPCAMASGAPNITIVEQNPQIAHMVRKNYNIPVVNQNPKAFLARSDTHYDIIHIENWGSSLPGSDALTQGYLFTTESFSEYLNHLTENGILIMARKLLLPPADSVRLWAEAYENLRSLEFKNPEQHIAILRNWSTFTLVVSVKPFNDMAALKDFAQNMNFDLVFLPGITKEMVNRFNIFDAPYYFFEINRLAEAYRSKTEKAYFETYPLDVAPQSDSRPFPGRFLKWSKLKALYKMTGSRFYSLFMSGELVVFVVFLQALSIAIFLLMLPVLAIKKKEKKQNISHLIYFLAVGAGFMFVELFFIKKYILIFGDPVISFTVVLTGILIFSGFGGYCSQRVGPGGLRNVLIALIAVLVLVFLGLDPMIRGILGFSKILQYALAILLLILPCFLVGFPFPLGMRYLLNRPAQRAYAWTANGCASVLASVLSAQIALSLGIPIIILCA